MTGAVGSRKKLDLIACAVAGMVVAACQVPAGTSSPSGDAAAASASTKLVGKSLLDAAREAERQGDFANATRYYSSVYNREPNNVTALVGMSRGLRNQNRAAEAEAVLARALSQAARDPELLSEMGKVQVALGKPLDAIESLSKAISMGASRWDVETALAVGYDRIGMYDKAERHYQNALTQNPGNAVVFNNFGLSRAQAGDLDGAVGLLEKAVALPESTPRMRQNLALLYAIRGDLLAAEALVSRDLSVADAEANMAYYRRLRQSVSQDGGPPRLPDLGSTVDARPNVGTVVADPAPSGNGRNGDVRMAAVPQQPVEAAPAAPLTAPPVETAAASGQAAQADSDPWKKVATPSKPGAAPSAPASEPPAPAASPPAPVASPPATAAPADTSPHPLRPTATAPATPAEPDKAPPTPAAAAPAPAAPTSAAPTPTAPTPTAPTPAASPPAAAVARVPQTTPKPPDAASPTPAPATSPAAVTRPVEQAARSVPAISSDPSGRFAVQIGSYREESRARQRIDSIGPAQADLLRNLDLSVVAAEVAGKGTYYRAMAGRIADYRDAQRLCDELKTRDIACLVVQAK